MRIPIIAGNWKMNKTTAEAVTFVQSLKKELGQLSDRLCVICPPFTALLSVAQELKGSGIEWGAQNLFWETEGAFTGEISSRMLKEIGASYCILGHCERRKILKETDEMVHRKVKKALAEGLSPIVCVGERLEEREKGITFDVIKSQVTQDLEGLKKEEVLRCVLAYEPVWAIGTGRNATPLQAQEVHAFIRKLLGEQFGEEAASKVRIQYGGSVKPDNIDELMAEDDVDGALVGGASLDIKSFARIVNFKV
ncbi:MAG: triose-phosphate isomerase [Chlamydiae bacterium]|nr:triose-phosphate isomerase [Chlamydiota bacterium]MBI3267322.1 triose-phosphate isomerase [Chlamydiota bacterium]